MFGDDDPFQEVMGKYNFNNLFGPDFDLFD